MSRTIRWLRNSPLSLLLFVGALVGLLVALPLARADYIIRDGGGNTQTILAFVCQTSKICPAHALIDSTGAEKATGANPLTLGRATIEVCVTPTITSGSSYSAGNVVGGLLAFNGAVNAGLLSGELRSVRLTSRSVQSAEFDVTFFSSQPTVSTWTDKAAPNIQAGDTPFAQPVLKLTNNYSGLGTHTVYGSDNLSRTVHLTTVTLYAVVTTPGTPTFLSSSDLQLCASVLRD